MTDNFSCPLCGCERPVSHSLEAIGSRCPGCGQTSHVPGRDSVNSAADVGLGSGGRREPAMDMTPMVDVTFLLLIFFMVTAAFTTQASIEFPSAEGEFGNNVGSEVVTVDIGDDGAFCVLTSEHEYVCPSVQELYVRLRGEMAKTPKPARLVVRASGGATHERVVIVLDAGAEVGLEDIQLETVDEDI